MNQSLGKLLVIFLLGWGGERSTPASETFSHGAVAAVHRLASEAGLAAMKRGGNAVDAAVAVGLTLGVVDSHNSGVGGGCFMVIRLPDQRVVALDGREMAPAAASRDMFVRQGQAETDLSQSGALAVGIPGSLRVYEVAAQRYGKLPLSEHFLAAAQLAEAGFPISNTYAERLAATAGELAKFDASKEIFLNAHGQAWPSGTILKQVDLAQSYRAMAESGVSWFYEGPFARATDRWMKAHGGIATEDDFRRYRWREREAVRSTYRGYEIIGFPPPSSGGVHVAQILNILENFDVKSLGENSAEFVHVVTEAMKLAFADRAHWLGDPDFARVPRGLLDKSYARRLAERIDLEKASEVTEAGLPDEADERVFGGHTTHFSAADRDGYWVACTSTLNLSFGSKVVIPGTGILLNDQMDDFSAQPGVPNAFGLIGAEANAVEPGKRPLSSMSPTLVLKDGRPVLSLGAAGGPTIITQVLLTILRVLDFENPVAEAWRAPRFHHQWRPDQLRMESEWPEAVVERLRLMGHKVRQVSSFGATQGVSWNPSNGGFIGIADPRTEGMAVGF